MNYRETFLVEPGASVKLSDFDPGLKPKHESKKAAIDEVDTCLQRLDELQLTLYAEHKHALLIVLQGLDAAGKDGTIRHVLTGMNPEGCRVTNFKQPTPQERDHDFLWRIHLHTPARGEVAIFNRSHYEDVLVVRVHDLVPKSIWSKRFDLINEFERNLQIENDTTIVKFFLHISKEEQLARFAKRLDDPRRQWKISEGDYQEREYWDAYTAAFEDVLNKTSTAHAPWFVIPSDHKWVRNLTISRILVETLQSMRIELPKPTVDLDLIRRRFHRAAAEAGEPDPV